MAAAATISVATGRIAAAVLTTLLIVNIVRLTMRVVRNNEDVP